MSRWFILGAALAVGSGCKGGNASPSPTDPPTATGAASPAAAAAPADAGPAEGSERTVLKFRELGSEANYRLGPATPRTAPYQPPSEAELPTLAFSRIAGGDGFFCGALTAGPLRCWGTVERTKIGAFVDVAVGAGLVCAATAAGEVQCFSPTTWEKQTIPTVSQVTRLAGSKSHVCALDRSGHVTCWKTDGAAALEAPAELHAKFIVTGEGFACAADAERKLVCWGETASLALPSEPLAVKDLAAGSRFLCALTSTGALRCFGEAPELGAVGITSLSGALTTLCANTSNDTWCAGGVKAKWLGVAKRFAIGERSTCVLLGNDLECQGPAGAAELAVPRQPASAAAGRAMSEADFLAFWARFPEAKIPQDFKPGSEFSVGSRLPERFDPLLGDDATTYRAGVRFTLPSGALAVTVLHLGSGRLELRTFSAKGVPKARTTLAAIEESRSALEEEADGKAHDERVGSAVESRLETDGQLHTARTNAREGTYYVKAHIDGRRPVSRRECDLGSEESRDTIEADGSFKRTMAQVVPGKKSVDPEGCEKSWPGGSY
ncbi:MAG TPA: RCC1 domain-containing protein [Polyangiaceae bacterium]|nr:RCC1 domain-containing protein [Polyangiaceae bacterium]